MSEFNLKYSPYNHNTELVRSGKYKLNVPFIYNKNGEITRSQSRHNIRPSNIYLSGDSSEDLRNLIKAGFDIDVGAVNLTYRGMTQITNASKRLFEIVEIIGSEVEVWLDRTYVGKAGELVSAKEYDHTEDDEDIKKYKNLLRAIRKINNILMSHNVCISSSEFLFIEDKNNFLELPDIIGDTKNIK